MVSDTLKLYPSGFLGSGTVEQTAPLSLEQVRHRMFDVMAITDPQPITANKTVDELWTKQCSGEHSVNTFEFHENVLKAAKQAFGLTSVMAWIEAQFTSQRLTSYHVDYIQETLAFVLHGTPRQYSYNVWYGLFQPNTVAKPLRSINEYAMLRELFGAYGQYKGLDFISLIAQWCQQYNGNEDLLQSLQLMFGRR